MTTSAVTTWAVASAAVASAAIIMVLMCIGDVGDAVRSEGAESYQGFSFRRYFFKDLPCSRVHSATTSFSGGARGANRGRPRRQPAIQDSWGSRVGLWCGVGFSC